ncbi:MAG: 30S ribosomal protein S5 [Candidatus Saccharibacteria bacterium]|nr:30S ribosomal protein S5 [Candidatus Saccharibacteria bacterium]
MENKQPKVINKSGTTKLTDEAVAAKEAKAEREFRGRRRDNRRNRRAADEGKKEFDTVNISINRVSRTVAGGRRMRFQALVAIGNHKNKVGVGMAKGNDVTSAVQKAERRAKKNMITINMNGDTICHEVETKVTGANVLMKPAAPGTGIIAGGVVRSIIGLTGIKDLISKSLGSTNKANIAYAVIEGLKQQVPRSEWNGAKKAAPKAEKSAKKEDK